MQRHLYTTEWRQIDATGGAGAEVLVISGDEFSVDFECLAPCVSPAELVAALRESMRETRERLQEQLGSEDES